MSNDRFAIIVVTYNRANALLRLLKSLSNAIYPNDLQPDLIISIDYSGSTACQDIAHEFHWQYGNKKVLTHKKNLGLKEHILTCGDFSEHYENIIVLEDDLFVSPYYFQYSMAVSEYYKNESKIAGCSLYSYTFNETAEQQFTPLNDDYSVFFLQLPSSWGQVWRCDQWKKFREWLSQEYKPEIVDDYLIPDNVIDWPETSWKKLFIFYMVIKDLYFVYPRISLTTNFMEPGVHHIKEDTFLQVPLQIQQSNYKFNRFSKSKCIYDAFCELSFNLLVKNSETLSSYDFEVDLYGTKPIKKVSKEYMLTSKRSYNPLYQFALKLKPHELNVIFDIHGNDINFSRVSVVDGSEYEASLLNRCCYYFNMPIFIPGLIGKVNIISITKRGLTRVINRLIK